VGFKSILGRTSIVTTFGFYGIVVFGLIYAVFALTNSEALGQTATLGYPFLVSTSLGVAGGLLGEAKGPVRIVIHIQLLLFLSGLMAALLILIRVRRDVGTRG